MTGDDSASVASSATPVRRGPQDRVAFFISYAGPDRAWAQWAGAQLEGAGYTVELDVWDWAVGGNAVLNMSAALQRSHRVLALWSPAYFERGRFTSDEWTAVMGERPDQNGEHRLIPFRVTRVDPPPILRPVIYRDLFDLPEQDARALLLSAVSGTAERTHQGFPGGPASPTGGAFQAGGFSGPRVPGSLPGVWNLPSRNPAFTGREVLLARLREQLQAGQRTLVQALNGMGGVGKTQLAVEYAHMFAGEYDLAWWIDAEQPALIGEQIAALAQSAGWAATDADTAAACAALAGRLRQSRGWLLVFDNVTTPEDVRDWLPQGPGHVVITTRHRGVTTLARPLGVQEFARPESIDLLTTHLPALSRQDADALGEALGDLPLALAQAAGLILETGMTVTEYLRELTEHSRDLLAGNRAGDYPRPLAAAIDLSLTRLAVRDPAAAQIMDLASVLAPDPIRLDWFRSAGPGVLPNPLAAVAGQSMALRRSLGRLGEFGLAQIDASTVQVHRLTQAVIRDSHTPEHLATLRQEAARLITSVAPNTDSNEPQTWPTWAALLPHLLALDPADPPTGASGFKSTAWQTLWYLLRRGEYHTVLPLAQAWHTAWTTTTDDPDDYDLAAITSTLATTHRYLGHDSEAVDLAQLYYDRQRRVLGDDAAATLSSANNLADSMRAVGRDGEALTLDQDTYDRRRRVLGLDHPDTLISASSLAIDLRAVGRGGEALTLGQDTYDRRRQVLGLDHPNTLLSAHSLAIDLSVAGRDGEALALDQDTYDRQRRVLGPDHPDTLISANNLAINLRAAGRHDEALALNQDTYDRRRRALGPDHPNTLTSAHNLAINLRLAGRDGEALTLDQDTYDRRRRVLGPDHPNTLNSASSLAIDLRAVGRGGEALTLDEDTDQRRGSKN